MINIAEQKPCAADKNYINLMDFLEDKGVTFSTQEQYEIFARMKGHASLSAMKEYESNSQKYMVLNVNVEDVVSEDEFCIKNTDRPLLTCGDLGAAIRFADLEAKDSGRVVAVCDGNGKLRHIGEAEHELISIFVSINEVKNPDAEHISETGAIDLDRYDSGYRFLSHAYLVANRACSLIRNHEYPRLINSEEDGLSYAPSNDRHDYVFVVDESGGPSHLKIISRIKVH